MKGETAGVPAGVVVGLRRLGVATVYEASGRKGLVDAPLERVVPGSRAAGPARTVLCGQGDNLAVHAALARVQPGEVLVLAMPEPVALVGEIIELLLGDRLIPPRYPMHRAASVPHSLRPLNA